jgi:hypothetical protein
MLSTPPPSRQMQASHPTLWRETRMPKRASEKTLLYTIYCVKARTLVKCGTQWAFGLKFEQFSSFAIPRRRGIQAATFKQKKKKKSAPATAKGQSADVQQMLPKGSRSSAKFLLHIIKWPEAWPPGAFPKHIHHHFPCSPGPKAFT